MCSPDLLQQLHNTGMQHAANMGIDVNALQQQASGASSPSLGAPVTNQVLPQPGQVAVPANVVPVGSTHDIYSYGGAGPGGAISGGPAPMGGGARSAPPPDAAPPPPNPLDPMQQQNRRQNLRQAMSPFLGTAVS